VELRVLELLATAPFEDLAHGHSARNRLATTVFANETDDGLHQSRLTQSRLSLHKHDLFLTFLRLFPAIFQQPELGITTDERARGKRCRSIESFVAAWRRYSRRFSVLGASG
jgi:hypothetical protein